MASPTQVVEFAYDWRLSNRVSANLLDRFVTSALSAWQARTANPHARVVFVCHSMGGLIVRYYLEVLGARDIARRVITIGTPYSGSVKSLFVLTGGLLGRLGKVGEALTQVARTFPSVYQLLPAYRCVVGEKGRNALAQEDVPGITRAMISGGLSFYEEIVAAVARNGPAPYDLFAFGGKKQPTLDLIRVDGGTIAFERSAPQAGGMDGQGDGTVPFYSALPPEAADTSAGIYVAARHSALQQHRVILDLVSDKVRAVELGSLLAPQRELSLNMPDIVAAGESVPVEATADRSDLLLHASLVGPEGLASDVRGVRLRPDGRGFYTVTLKPPPVRCTWRVVVEVMEDGATIEDLLTVV
jgi:hypothetical protein